MKKILDLYKILIPTKKIFRGLKNASYLAIAHIFSMAINLIGFIFIARLLGPDNYGIYTTVVAFVAMFDIITFYGINKVVLREGAKDLKQMSDFLEKTTGIKNLLTFFAICICIIFSLFTPYSVNIKIYIIIFAFSLIYTSFNGFLSTVYKAAEKMQYNAILTIINRTMFVSLSILFLYLGYGVLSLFIIALFSEFFNLILNFKLTKKFVIFKFWNRIIIDKRLLKSALIFSILSFSFMLAGKIDLVMISFLGTTKDVGIYGVAYRIMALGLTTRDLISTAFFPIFVKSYHKSKIRWKSLIKYSVILGIGLFLLSLILSFFSEPLISLLLGGEYLESGTILSVLIFAVAIAYFTIPFTNTLQATHNELQILKICWIPPIVNIGLNYLFFNIFGLIGIAYSTLIVTSAGLILYFIITKRILKIQKKLI